ncbi:proto-oncogene c-Rel-like isoform X1 [Macrobrachium nipponense]|uniref:proto-oncogene c-Rel-like isoform X1 n=1 Tax=Macrobrachium nipponense TaxID=159736 RepID=UPI0030C8702F
MADPRSVSMRNTNTLDYNISDIIDVIKEDYQGLDTEYGGAVVGSAIGSEDNYSVVTQESCNDPDYALKRKAYVKILEQPQAKALRFRYMCEGRSAGSIPGVRSTADNKTFPGIQVVGYKGPAVVVVSCVTVDPPYRPHPHNLVGKEGCKKGICTMTINSDTMQCMFSNLGIQCIKKRDVEDALKLREEIRVDPFQTGFSHRNQPQSIDLNSLRLCFQVFLEGSEKGKFTFPLKPVVSDPIYDKKAACDLNICKLSDCTSSVAGGKEIILLCEKVTKEDIQVRFYEVKDGRIEWEAFGDFQASDVHKQVAISFKTPRYKTLEVENPVKVYVQLLRPTDKSTSEPRNFHFLPLDSDPLYVKRKVAKLGNSNNADKLVKFVAENVGPGVYGDVAMSGVGAVQRPVIIANRTKFGDRIKKEPTDIGSPVSPLFNMVKSPANQSVSPHYGGGTLYTVPSQSLSPVPHGTYYAQQSPVHNEAVGVAMMPSPGIPDRRVSSPGQPYYHVHDAQSPYSQDPGMAGLDAVGLEGYVHPQSVSSSPQGPPISQLLDLDSKKYIDQSNIELDINNINSAELRSLLPSENDFNASMVDAHLSENLSSNLNLIDHPPQMNKLNSKSGVSMSVHVPYLQNIPTDTQPEMAAPSTSDSLNNLKSEIELLNQLSAKP